MGGKKAKCKCGMLLQIPTEREAMKASQPGKVGAANPKSASRPASTNPAASAAPSKGNSGTIAVKCGTCGKTLQVPVTMAGKKGKCKCGGTIVVPAATARQAVANALPDAMFDELTQNDFGQQATNPYAAVASSSRGEGKLLKTFINEEAEEEEKKKKTLVVIALSILHLIGALGYGVMAIIGLALAATFADVIAQTPYAALGAGLFIGVFAIFALFDAAVFLGLLLKKSFGWWFAMISLSWGVWARASDLIAELLSTQDAIASIPKMIGAVIGGLLCVILSNSLADDDVKERFGVKTKNGIVYAISMAIGFLLGMSLLLVFLLSRDAG
jgi:hypothetical protein